MRRDQAPTRPTGAPWRRLLEVTVYVWLLIAAGLLLGFRDEGLNGVTAYLLLTTATTVLFQRFVARRPLRWMWVHGSDDPVSFRTVNPYVVVALAIYPAYSLVDALLDGKEWSAAYSALSLVGAVGAGYAFRRFTLSTWKYLLYCMLTAGVLGCGLTLLAALHGLTHPIGDLFGTSDLGVFVTSLLTFLPVVFVMEEVTFRGCVDAHAHHEGDRFGVLTAIWVSALWGWWHMGTLPDTNPINVLVLQVPMGTFLSIWWRRSRNLGVSGTTHAFNDSFRNALGDIPS